jgi:hypothetical protein
MSSSGQVRLNFPQLKITDSLLSEVTSDRKLTLAHPPLESSQSDLLSNALLNG